MRYDSAAGFHLRLATRSIHNFNTLTAEDIIPFVCILYANKYTF